MYEVPGNPEAVVLHTGAGHRAIGPFGGYAEAPDAGDALFFERTLP